MSVVLPFVDDKAASAPNTRYEDPLRRPGRSLARRRRNGSSYRVFGAEAALNESGSPGVRSPEALNPGLTDPPASKPLPGWCRSVRRAGLGLDRRFALVQGPLAVRSGWLPCLAPGATDGSKVFAAPGG